MPSPPVSSLRSNRVLVIVNPVAGKGRGRRQWEHIRPMLRARGLVFTEVVAEQPMHAWALAEQAARNGYDVVAAVGGDGTTHEVINGLLQGRPERPPVLAVIPGGTGNDFARGVGIPLDPQAAALLLVDGSRRRVDIGRVNTRYYGTISGVGFDAEVADKVNRWPKWIGGTPLYLAGAVKMLVTYRPADAILTIDGVRKRVKLFLLAAANTPRYAGGMHMAPHALVDDGKLAVVYALDLSRVETLALLPRVFTGRHLMHPKVAHTTAAEVRVESAEPLAIHADGESIGRVPATFTVVPGAIEVVVPKTR